MTIVSFAALGLIVGSFLNVVIHRVPRKLSLVRPGSACTACGAPVRAYDNVPVLAWLWLRGRCRDCGVRISPRYPLVELLTGGLFAAAALRFDVVEEAAFAAAACDVFLALAVIDLDHRKVPNVIVLPSTAAALIWVAGASAASGDWRPVIWSAAMGAVGFALLLAIALVSGGMGGGDVKLAAFIGVVAGRFGWEAFVLALFAGFVVGGMTALTLLAFGGRSRKDAIPFAPMLAAGAVLAVFAGAGPVRSWWGL